MSNWSILLKFRERKYERKKISKCKKIVRKEELFRDKMYIQNLERKCMETN